MTPKRHAIAKEIIKLLYPGPPFGGELFSIYSGTLAGVMPNSEQLAAMGLTQAQARSLLGK